MPVSINDAAIHAVLKYHQQTKHHFQAYAPSPGFLDWDSQPNPFRTFEGSEKIDLPLLKEQKSPKDLNYAELFETPRSTHPFTMDCLGQLFELAAGLSAWKSDGHSKWALRNNPSSGNLHPTEFYIFIWQQTEGTPQPGLYHYNALQHQLEFRAILQEQTCKEILQRAPNSYGAIALTSVLWREEWKYGARAYRYCQHDVGHALASLRFAARTLGWHLALFNEIGDDSLAQCLGLDRDDDFANAEPEHPDCLAILGTGKHTELADSNIWPSIADSLYEWQGKANRLSRESITWPEIKKVLPHVKKPDFKGEWPADEERPAPEMPVSTYDHSAIKVIQKRRSAQRMSDKRQMKEKDFKQILQRTLPTANTAPFDALGSAPAIQLLVYVHNVENIESGLYAFGRSEQLMNALISDCEVKNYLWQPSGQDNFPLFRLEAPLNASKLASQLHCYQGIAGKSAFAVDMFADTQLLNTLGAWSYRRLFWEAGFIGQVLYLEAEALGYNGTGIGCYFDDEVHRLMGLDTKGRWQCLYGFTIGEALVDQRLTHYSGYVHLSRK